MARLLALFFLVVALPSVPAAQSAQRGWAFAQSLGASINPLGAQSDTRLHYRVPLWGKQGLLWDNSRLDIGAQNDWTPADEFIGPHIVFEPIAFFDITARAGFYLLYSAFGYGYFSLSGSDASYGDRALDSLSGQTVAGYWLTVAPTLKAKVRRVIVANTTTLSRISMNEEGHYLEVRSYLVHQSEDADLINETYLVWEFSEQLMAGASFRVVSVFGAGTRSQRITGLAILQPRTRRLSAFRVLAAGGRYLRDPLFEGEPFIGLMVTMEISPSPQRDTQ